LEFNAYQLGLLTGEQSIKFHSISYSHCIFIKFTPLNTQKNQINATYSNISAISWRPVLVVEEARVPGENYRPWASNW